MKVDLDYMASILKVFIDAETAHVTYKDIKAAGVTVVENDKLSEKFIFHLQIAIDNQLIGSNSGAVFSLKDIGFIQSLDGLYSIALLPIRLTQRGHDFAASLNNNEVLSRLKTEFKDAPFKIVFETGQKLLEFYMQKKLEKILN